MHGASLKDWLAVSEYSKKTPRLLVYDSTSKTVRFADEEDAPWYVIMFLSQFHHKHRFIADSLPSLKGVELAVQQLVHKLKWAWVHRHNNSLHVLPRLGPKSTVPCMEIVPPEIQAVSRRAANAVLKACRKACQHHRPRDHRFSNFTGLYRLASEWIRDSRWAVVQSDKDGCLALVTRTQLVDVHKQLLDTCWYRPAAASDVTAAFIACKSLANKFGKRVETFEGIEGIADEMRVSWRECCENNMARSLEVTCKSHKHPGEVVCRNIHGGGRWPLAGVGAWLTRHLRKITRSLPHILTSSADLVKKLHCLQLPPCCKLVKIDIKDFFLTGTPAELARAVSSLFDNVRERELVRDAILLLTEHQYIKSKFYPGEFWKLTYGAGMGLNFSAELCDVALYALAEKRWATVAGICSYHRLQAYYRFRDDVLAIFEHTPAMSKWYRVFRARAAPYKTIVETVSSETVPMLDVQVTLVSANGGQRIKTGIHIKPTAHKIPLSAESCHPPSVHVYWPKSELERRYRLCRNDKPELKRVSEIFAHQFEVQNEHPLIARLLRKPLCAKIRKPLSDLSAHIFLVLRFHPVWHQTARLGAVLKQLNEDPNLKSLWQIVSSKPPPVISVAWRSAASPFVTELQALTHMRP